MNSATLKRTWSLVLALMLMLLSSPSWSAEIFVSRSTSAVNASSIRPGDTITLAGGVRGPLRIYNAQGSADRPITIRNDPSASAPVVIQRSKAQNGGFPFACESCVNVIIDGTGKWQGAAQSAYCGAPSGTNGCGIRVTTVAEDDKPTSFVKISGLSRNLTMRGVEVDGKWPKVAAKGIGVSVNDQAVTAGRYPGFRRENITLERNYIHHVGTEGFYVGPNWLWDNDTTPLRNITLRHNLVKNAGWDGINLKAAITGSNSVFGNYVIDCGLKTDRYQLNGINVTNSTVTIDSNYVVRTGEHGIHVHTGEIAPGYGPFVVRIFNNIVVGNTKNAVRPRNGINIAAGGKAATIDPSVWNNTVVRIPDVGIYIGNRIPGSATDIRNNILAEVSSTIEVPKGSALSNNRSGSVGSFGFVDPSGLDFRLSAGSPARDAGSASGFPSKDYRGVPRPQEGWSDLGAYEFIRNPPPKSPVLEN